MKKLSTGVLVALFAAGLGLSAVAAPSSPASQGNTGPYAIAQAPVAQATATDTSAPGTTATMAPGTMSTSAPGTMSTSSPGTMSTASPGTMSTSAPGTMSTAGPGTTGPASSGTGAAAPPPANFGAPPSGQIPILFNDRHVYAKPDRLKQGRVLAAIVRGGTILIPLRSMFEQMGATVSYDPGTRTVSVTKPGSDVKVTVGRPQVTINGEARPLDVPPEIYQGHVVVPVRVISEGMGAYVQWVPERRTVVVRYVAATPPPPATSPPPTTPVVTPSPSPVPVRAPYLDKFIAGDFILSPKVYNEFSPGNRGRNSGGSSYHVRGAVEFPLFNLPWMLEGDYRVFNYPHNQGAITPTFTPGTAIPCSVVTGTVDPTSGATDTGCVTVIGGGGQTFVPAFSVRDYDFDGRFGLKVADPRIYVGVGYMYRSGNYGYPKLRGVGFGLEKLPDLDQPFSIYGSAWYYPNVKGNCGIDVCPTGPFNLAYRILKYQIGGTFGFGTSPLFLDFGFLGDRMTNKDNAPVGQTHNGPYIGLGLHF